MEKQEEKPIWFDGFVLKFRFCSFSNINSEDVVCQEDREM